MRHNNKGLSLVELIVVIAIMSVLTGVVSFGISNIFNTKVTQCADNMENIINKVRVNTMGRNEVTLRFDQDSDGRYFSETKEKKGYGSTATVETVTEQVGKSGMGVKFTTDSSITDPSASGVQTLSNADGNEIKIQFDRSSGEVKVDGSGACVRKIWIIRNTKVKTITIYKETGKVVVD